MDFSTWSPSHTILLLGMILSTIVTAIVQVSLLFYRVRLLEKRIDQTDDRIERVKSEMSNLISEVKTEIMNDRNQNQASWRDLNQHLMNHLEGHPNPQQQPQVPTISEGGMPNLETVKELVKLGGEISND